MVVSLLLLIASTEAGAGGTVLQFQPMYSEALDANAHYGIYLPEGYDTSEDRYPVIYFLHGDGYSYWIYWYMGLADALDYLIAYGVIDPVIVVTPDGLQEEPWNAACWTNTEFYGNYEDYVVNDLVHHIDENYRTEPDWWNRSIQGLSTGSIGAATLGLKRPNVFNGFAGHSGPLDLEAMIGIQRPHVLNEYPAGPPYDFDPTAGMFSSLFFKKAAEYSPNLDNPPYFVDFPLDEWGQIVNSVAARWQLESPVHLASLLSTPWGPEKPEIYFDCGTLDEYHGYPINVAFANSLDELGIPYVFESFEGGHSDQFASRFMVGVGFLSAAMARWEEVALDILPDRCPNRLELDDEENIKMVIAGSVDLDVRDIDTASLLLASEIAPLRIKFTDDVTHFLGEDCECPVDGDEDEGDGIEDIRLKFEMEDVLALLGDMQIGEEYQLSITGSLLSGEPFFGVDCLIIVDDDDEEDFAGKDLELADLSFSLLRVTQPGHFQRNVRLIYRVPDESVVSLGVYDLTGRLVEQLVDQSQAPGEYESTWNAMGRPSGVYFCRLHTGTATETQKVILLPTNR
jgi:S-formylglutathione hydrolase FrmB